MNPPKWLKGIRERGKPISPLTYLSRQAKRYEAREETEIGMNVNRWELIRLGTTSKLPVSVDVHLDLGQLEARMKKRVLKALDRGFYMGYTGPGTDVYDLLCRCYGVPYAQLKRDQRSRFGSEPAWRVKLSPDGLGKDVAPPKLKGLMLAEQTADRMADADERERMQRYRNHWESRDNRWAIFYHIKSAPMLEDALQERLVGHEVELQNAKDALADGRTLTFRQK